MGTVAGLCGFDAMMDGLEPWIELRGLELSAPRARRCGCASMEAVG